VRIPSSSLGYSVELKPSIVSLVGLGSLPSSYTPSNRRMIEELAFAKAKGASIAELSEIFQKEDSIVKLANLAENTPSVQSS